MASIHFLLFLSAPLRCWQRLPTKHCNRIPHDSHLPAEIVVELVRVWTCDETPAQNKQTEGVNSAQRTRDITTET